MEKNYSVKNLLKNLLHGYDNYQLVHEEGHGLDRTTTVVCESWDIDILIDYCEDHGIKEHRGYAWTKDTFICYI